MRKPRRAQDTTISDEQIAPGLSRGVGRGLFKVVANPKPRSAPAEGQREAPSRGSNPTRTNQSRNNILGAPRFSPYRP
jgi:hypothetical protein